MTEYRKCKRCGNENRTEVYSCRYCGIIYCDACRLKSKCPKTSADGLQEHWEETIGYVSGFCDICHRSMYGNERVNIGEYNILSGHENCLNDFLETEEGEKWLENEKKEKEEEPKRAERRRIETERMRIENLKKLAALEEMIRKQEEEERRITHQQYLNEVKKTKFRKIMQFIILPLSMILGLQIIFKINLFPIPVKMTWLLIILGIEYIIYLIVTLFLENKFDIEFDHYSNIFKSIIFNSICFLIIIFAIRFYFSRQ